MASSYLIRFLESSLPLCGFADGQKNAPLDSWPDNRYYLYRVWKTWGTTLRRDLGFVPARFAGFTDKTRLQAAIETQRTRICNYGQMEEHIEHGEDPTAIRGGTPFVSTSMSIFWCIANAIKTGIPHHDIFISLIRIHDMPRENLFLGFEYVNSPFAEKSQEVLVYGYIPEDAVASTVSLADLFTHAPTWLSPDNISQRADEFNPTCETYNIAWANTFLQQDHTHNRHLEVVTRWAYHLLATRAGYVVTYEDVFHLALYLYRWPFRAHNAGSTSAPYIEGCVAYVEAEIVRQLGISPTPLRRRI